MSHVVQSSVFTQTSLILICSLSGDRVIVSAIIHTCVYTETKVVLINFNVENKSIHRIQEKKKALSPNGEEIDTDVFLSQISQKSFFNSLLIYKNHKNELTVPLIPMG